MASNLMVVKMLVSPEEMELVHLDYTIWTLNNFHISPRFYQSKISICSIDFFLVKYQTIKFFVRILIHLRSSFDITIFKVHVKTLLFFQIVIPLSSVCSFTTCSFKFFCSSHLIILVCSICFSALMVDC